MSSEPRAWNRCESVLSFRLRIARLTGNPQGTGSSGDSSTPGRFSVIYLGGPTVSGAETGRFTGAVDTTAPERTGLSLPHPPTCESYQAARRLLPLSSLPAPLSVAWSPRLWRRQLSREGSRRGTCCRPSRCRRQDRRSHSCAPRGRKTNPADRGKGSFYSRAHTSWIERGAVPPPLPPPEPSLPSATGIPLATAQAVPPGEARPHTSSTATQQWSGGKARSDSFGSDPWPQGVKRLTARPARRTAGGSPRPDSGPPGPSSLSIGRTGDSGALLSRSRA